jgi:pyrimidine operon attenuation protein/uracil phosphoribosyltransferase
MAEKKYILTKEEASHKIERLALEVAEYIQDANEELIIIGIRESGTLIATKIYDLLQQYIKSPINLLVAKLDKTKPVDVVFDKDVDFNGKNILIVDDVANSGKTLLYALKPLLVFHPKQIQTLVLVERMHKLFPVKPDFVGLSMATTLEDYIQVEIIDNEIAGAFIG